MSNLLNAKLSFPDVNVQALWEINNNGANDMYGDSNKVLKAVEVNYSKRLMRDLPFQGALFSFLFDH